MSKPYQLPTDINKLDPKNVEVVDILCKAFVDALPSRKLPEQLYAPAAAEFMSGASYLAALQGKEEFELLLRSVAVSTALQGIQVMEFLSSNGLRGVDLVRTSLITEEQFDAMQEAANSTLN
jgi:hypothetical protein